MNFGWVTPFVASIGRKLYVLGGPNEREKSPDREFYWGEIYDLDSKEWKVLELDINTFPDFIDSNWHVVEKDGEGTRIILFLFSMECLLFYNVNTHEFLIEDHPSLNLSRPDPEQPDCGGIWELRGNLPMLNNSILYWFTDDLYLYGYDLVEKRWFLSKCLKKELWTIPPKTWWDANDDPRKQILVDLCNGKFLVIVEKGGGKLAVAILLVVKDKDSLNVSVESLHTLLVDPSFIL
ncbi:hypothetical protein A4A49_27401 [Nicotiana attenuata]|uniref:F-boxkelch-repeat protein n=1 Tax=Nicotiana attenuata TaxID=49451 RepID=A0A1J6IIG2_NICAT|nr:hypothetical protein A4A49_27401 [Nicotiana attenuata]